MTHQTSDDCWYIGAEGNCLAPNEFEVSTCQGICTRSNQCPTYIPAHIVENDEDDCSDIGCSSIDID